MNMKHARLQIAMIDVLIKASVGHCPDRMAQKLRKRGLTTTAEELYPLLCDLVNRGFAVVRREQQHGESTPIFERSPGAGGLLLNAAASIAAETQPDWSECSGDPSSCPENEGYGCCKRNPPSNAALSRHGPITPDGAK